MSSKFPAIPEAVRNNPDSLYATVSALKEGVETLTGQRRGMLPPVTWDDLLRLGLCKPEDVPRPLL